MKFKEATMGRLKWNDDVKLALSVLTTFTVALVLSGAAVLALTFYAR